MKKERLLLVVAMALATIGALSSCSTDDFGPDNTGEGTPDEEGKIVFDISFAPTGDDGQQTRVATSTNFKSEWEDGDEIGVFCALLDPNTGGSIFRLNYKGQLFIDAPLTDGVSLAWSKVAKFTRSLPTSASSSR